ncbi:hypothetical protein ACF0H5_019781 [Mactra antiquata]
MNVLCSCVVLISGICCIYATGRNQKNDESAEFWNKFAGDELKKAKRTKPNIAVAKNVIMFLGDGMGVSTVTAGRILKGQLNGRTGEEELLSFEEFPHVALSKTYNSDSQTADSAGTATAFLSGVKTNLGVLGVDARVIRKDCASMVESTKLQSILHWSKAAGKSVGIVSTARITHATPAAAYAQTADRNWENDEDMIESNCSIKDIARQLVEDNPDIEVILGGGRSKFLLNNTMDPQNGLITDGRLDKDLTQVWQETQHTKNRAYKYVWNQTDFNSVDPASTDYLLGLFNKGHMSFEIDRQNEDEPSIAEMTKKAIEILSKNDKGFFLLVEGGRIDHGHHYSQAVRALHETLAMADAVQEAVKMTKESDTLIVTTADHSHVFTIGGYPTRGNPIFGLTDDREGGYKLGDDGKPMTTLLYSNGPGGYSDVNATTRPDLTGVATDTKDYRQQSAVKIYSETHGGEDVAIYARGPMSHLFHGVHEQNYIAHVMAYASCVGSYSSPDSCAMADVAEITSSGTSSMLNKVLILISFVITFNCL